MVAAIRLGLAAIALVALSACYNTLPQADLKGIAEEARMMANNATIETTAIADVKPQSIRVESDGVYIKVGGWLADEWGFFVPIDPAFTPAPDAFEPSFKSLGEGVWHYYFAG
jgi:hypothetical protein